MQEWNFAAFSPPYTVQGSSALVTAPPWHYAGWLLNIEFHFDLTLASGWYPTELGQATGIGSVHFADWQATSSGDELLDPIYSQYKETIVILQIKQSDGSMISYCPAIWVDQDISLLRGLLQGWPKKFGSTWLTRCMPLAHPAAAPLQQGSKLGASLCIKDRRFIDASAELTGKAGVALGFLKNPVVGLVGLPNLSEPAAAVELKFVRAQIGDLVSSGWHEVNAQLQFNSHPYEELSILGCVKVSNASVGWIGLTIKGTVDV